MLYLAEVQIQKGGVFGGNKAQLKLLACQRADQSWAEVQGEELIPAPDDVSNLGSGVMVMVNLGNNRQIQGDVEPAARQLLGIFKQFSKTLEKSRQGEEEIEAWKQSLTYQSQELNRREMEMEAKLEQIQQMEAEFERLEQQRQEINIAQDSASRLQEELDRNRHELELAWEQLRSEQARLENQANQGAILGQEQANYIQSILNQLSGAVPPTALVRDHLNQAWDFLNQQQEILNQHWARLDQHRQSASQLQQTVDRQTQELPNKKQELQQLQASVDEIKAQLQAQQKSLESKQEALQILTAQKQQQEDLHQQLSRLAVSSSGIKISKSVDIQHLEQMPLGELESLVSHLQQETDKFVRFVNDQEEELRYQKQVIDEVQAKINQANDFDRLTLEGEMAEEQDRYQMLEETLIGQRKTLREREEIFHQHQRILRKRQGIPDEEGDQRIDLGPVLSQLESQSQQQTEELQRWETQVSEMQNSVQQLQETFNRQVGDLDGKRRDLEQLEQEWQQNKQQMATLSAQVDTYQEMLQPVQDRLNDIRQRLEEMANGLNQLQETGDYQLQAIAQLQQTIGTMMQQ